MPFGYTLFEIIWLNLSVAEYIGNSEQETLYIVNWRSVPIGFRCTVVWILVGSL